MRKIAATIVSLFFLTVLPVMSQGGSSGFSLMPGTGSFLSDENLNTSLRMGTGVTLFGGGNSMVTSYISPSMSYKFDSGFTLHLGGTFASDNFGGMPRSVVLRDGSTDNVSSAGSYSLYAAGSWKVNENLTVSGMMFHEEGYIPVHQPRLNPALGYTMQGASMKLDYSINERLHFGAGITVKQGNSPYYSPFGTQRGLYGGRPGSIFLRE